ncbi:MAG: hypothetical protein AAF772_11270 [Acidobacteriota bacterium]
MNSRRHQAGSIGARAFVLACAALMIGATAVVFAGELKGEIELTGRGSKRAALQHGVVWFVSDAAVERPAPYAEPVDMATVRKSFVPRVRAVPVGTTVRFPNQDPILHNVFSVTPNNSFDLGLYKRGESASYTFEHPGVVRVFCNVHHGMIAYVVAVDTPYYAQLDRDGIFHLTELPEGPGTLTIWHERTGLSEHAVTVPAAAAAAARTFTLEVSLPPLPPHRNKFGKPYARGRAKRYGGSP